MGPADSTSENSAHSPESAPSSAVRHVLVVEPETLVRWSLVTYLAKWFDVVAADSRDSAERILDDQPIEAVVVSDDLSDRAAEAITAYARLRNPTTRVVRTVTHPPGREPLKRGTHCLEKPFQLSDVAMLLGAMDAPNGRERTDHSRGATPTDAPPKRYRQQA